MVKLNKLKRIICDDSPQKVIFWNTDKSKGWNYLVQIRKVESKGIMIQIFLFVNVKYLRTHFKLNLKWLLF